MKYTIESLVTSNAVKVSVDTLVDIVSYSARQIQTELQKKYPDIKVKNYNDNSYTEIIINVNRGNLTDYMQVVMDIKTAVDTIMDKYPEIHVSGEI